MTETTDYPKLKYELHQTPSFVGMDRIIKGLIGKEEWDDSLAKAVKDLHDGVNRQNSVGEPIPNTGLPPKIILVTATSAVPYAFAIKESLRTAYPKEELPKFFLIDVSKQRFGDNKRYQRILTDEEIEEIKFEEAVNVRHVGEKYNALENVAVFDEFQNSGATMRKAGVLLDEAGFQNINFMIGHWGQIKTDWGHPVEDRPIRRKGGENTPYQPLGFNINTASKKIVEDMKTIGKLMGQEILRHAA